MIDSKSILARLLANENIQVEQGNFSTASFDVRSRVLRLPFWEDISNDVYDLFIGHEVAHALYTPDSEEVENLPYPFSYLSIVEDVRIEKLVLRKYPGLLANFKRGYAQLIQERDFLKLSKRDVSKLGFMDRLNIYQKSRGCVAVPFTEEESTWVRKTELTETFEEVLDLTRQIAEWLKERSEEQEQEETEPEDSGEEQEQEETERQEESSEETEESEETSENQCSSTDEQEESSEETEAESEKDSEEFVPETNADFDNDDFEDAKTDSAMEEIQKKLFQESTIYLRGFDKKSVDLSTISANEVLEYRKGCSYYRKHDAYKTFLKEVSAASKPLILEFERRKAAWQSHKARVGRKGTIDVNKIHKYLYDDQIFREVMYRPDGKSHGMVFLLDNSESMRTSYEKTFFQLSVLIDFCKKVGINFQVFCFTNEFFDIGNMVNPKKRAHHKSELFFRDNLLLTEQISSDMSKALYAKAHEEFFYSAMIRGNSSSFYSAMSRGNSFSGVDKMGSTPLFSAIASMRVKIKEFQNRHKVQNMNLVLLTDGEDTTQNVIGNATKDFQADKIILDVEGHKLRVDIQSGYGGTHSVTKGSIVSALDMIRDMNVSIFNFYQFDDVKEACEKYERETYDVNKRAEFKETITKTGVVSVDEKDGYDRFFYIAPVKTKGNTKITHRTSAKVAARKITEMSKEKNAKKIIAKKFCEIVA